MPEGRRARPEWRQGQEPVGRPAMAADGEQRTLRTGHLLQRASVDDAGAALRVGSHTGGRLHQ
eukprot:872955-Prymnesium_polylepis.1